MKDKRVVNLSAYRRETGRDSYGRNDILESLREYVYEKKYVRKQNLFYSLVDKYASLSSMLLSFMYISCLVVYNAICTLIIFSGENGLMFYFCKFFMECFFFLALVMSASMHFDKKLYNGSQLVRRKVIG